MRPDHECQSEQDNDNRHGLTAGLAFFVRHRRDLNRLLLNRRQEARELSSGLAQIVIDNPSRLEAEFFTNGIQVAAQVGFHRERLPVAAFDKRNVFYCEFRHSGEILNG